MPLVLAVLGILLAFTGALGPGILFLVPRLNPSIWYRFDQRRTILVGCGVVLILAAFLLSRSFIWPLVFIPVVIGLRAFLRPERVIQALDDPRILPASEADLPPDNFVLTADIEGQARAWPMEVVIAHHLIHDRVGEVPILASW